MLLSYLSKALVLNEDFISAVADTASKRYKKYQIDKADGTKRTIYHPAKELKVLQRLIHDDILSKLPVHEAATAYVPGSSTRKNAETHKNAKYLLRLDFKGFFESIKVNDVSCFIDDVKHNFDPDWNDDDTELFKKLVCFNGRLTIGSVTSPMLSNAMCYELDSKISNLCGPANIKYSRYADDMFFSTNDADQLFKITTAIKNIVRSLEVPKSLWINFKKTRHSSKKRKMSVTGLVLTNAGHVSIGRKKKREIKSLVYKWISLSPSEKKYLKGYLSYCRSVEPEFINSLCEKYGATIVRDIQKYTEI